MSASLTVVVHGATGTQGAPVVLKIVEAGHRVRAAVRNPWPGALPAGVDPVAVDLADTKYLSEVYSGADAVVVQLPLAFAPDLAVPQAEAVLTALAQAQVPRAVFNNGGVAAPEPVGVPYVDARVLLARELPNAVKTAVTIGPAGPYLDNLSEPWSVARIHEQGHLAYPLPGDLALPWVALDDLAAVITELLTEDAPPARLAASGPQLLTGEQAAAEVSAAMGRPIPWVTIPPSAFGQMLAPHLGAEAAAGVAALYSALADAPMPAPDPNTLRPGTITVRQWASRQDWTTPR